LLVEDLFAGYTDPMALTKQLDPRRIKALALDLDGTALGPDTVMSERTVRTLRACIARGIRVILCTGRSVKAAEKYRELIDARGPMVYYNGAEVSEAPSGRILKTVLLDPEVVEYCVDLSRREGIYYQVYLPGPALKDLVPNDSRNILMAERLTGETEMYRNHTGVQALIGDIKAALSRAVPPGCLKGMFLGESAVLDRIRPVLAERFGSRVYIAKTFVSFLETMDAAASKGRGLGAALEYLGLSPEEVIALGDEENDIPLFAAAGYSAAPANAKDPVRAAADRIIGPNTEDGPAAFLEELFGL
jgi:Cof subfamily protein (haloacid dehalogenase superfamily)